MLILGELLALLRSLVDLARSIIDAFGDRRDEGAYRPRHMEPRRGRSAHRYKRGH